MIIIIIIIIVIVIIIIIFIIPIISIIFTFVGWARYSQQHKLQDKLDSGPDMYPRTKTLHNYKEMHSSLLILRMGNQVVIGWNTLSKAH